MYYEENENTRAIIAYNFLGQYVNTIPRDIIEEELRDMGLNDLVDELNEIATQDHLSVLDYINMIYDEIEDYIEEFEEENEEDLYEILSPILEDIFLISVHGGGENEELYYDAFTTIQSPEIPEKTKNTIDKIITSLPMEDIVNSNIIVIFINIVQYGQPILKIRFQ